MPPEIGSSQTWLPSSRGVPILAYHGLYEKPDECVAWPKSVTRYWVSVGEFRRQIDVLANHGYLAIPLASLARASIPLRVAKPIVITFDDGWASDVRYATPILNRLGWGSEHFVTVGWIGRSGFMSWAALAELVASNRGVHSHTMTHANLDRTGTADLRRELELSKSTLESTLGRAVDFLALPGGTGAAAAVVRLARSLGYVGICTSKIGVNRPGADPYSLRRITVTENTSIDMLLRWVNGADLLHSKLQQATLRGVRGLVGRRLYEYLKEAVL